MKVEIGKYPKNPTKTPRKIKIRLDEWDTFSAYTDLALIIHPLLLKIKEAKSGVPMWCLREVGAGPNYSDEELERARVVWHNTLDQMIWSFYELSADETNEPSSPGDLKWDEDGIGSRVNWTPEEVAKWREEFSAYQEKLKKGLILFGEHYQCLWT